MSTFDAALADAHRTQSADEAIVVQHTLYPYHFVHNSARLNDIGRHDLDVLAWHFKDDAGPLSVRRGDAPEPLYRARIKTVVDALAAAGVAGDRIKIDPGLPGGDGLSSDEVVRVLAKRASPPSGAATAGATNSAGTGAGTSAYSTDMNLGRAGQ